MSMVINYLFGGIIFMFIIDCINYYNKDHKAFQDLPELGLRERILFVLFWPIMFITFISAFIKEYFK